MQFDNYKSIKPKLRKSRQADFVRGRYIPIGVQMFNESARDNQLLHNSHHMSSIYNPAKLRGGIENLIDRALLAKRQNEELDDKTITKGLVEQFSFTEYDALVPGMLVLQDMMGIAYTHSGKKFPYKAQLNLSTIPTRFDVTTQIQPNKDRNRYCLRTSLDDLPSTMKKRFPGSKTVVYVGDEDTVGLTQGPQPEYGINVGSRDIELATEETRRESYAQQVQLAHPEIGMSTIALQYALIGTSGALLETFKNLGVEKLRKRSEPDAEAMQDIRQVCAARNLQPSFMQLSYETLTTPQDLETAFLGNTLVYNLSGFSKNTFNIKGRGQYTANMVVQDKTTQLPLVAIAAELTPFDGSKFAFISEFIRTQIKKGLNSNN